MKRSRIIAAFLLSPFAGALYLVVLCVVLRYFNPRDIIGNISMFAIFAIIGYIAEVTLGIPLLLLFRRFRVSGLLEFLLGGLVIGIAVWIVVLIWLFVGSVKPDNPFVFRLLLGLLGCIAPAIISAAVFWFLGASADNKALQLTAR